MTVHLQRLQWLPYRTKSSETSTIASDLELNNDDLSDCNDEFDMETGGWCCFTNSLPIIYLFMWLNEKPNLASFINRQITMDVELDTGNAEASKKRRASGSSISARNDKIKKRSSNEQTADAIIGYIKVKEAEAVQLNNMSHSLSVSYSVT